MVKKVSSVLSLILALALLFSLAACGGDKGASGGMATEAADNETEAAVTEPVVGVAVGDTFAYSGRTITLIEINDGADEKFDAGTAEGKWVTLKFAIDDGDSAFEIDSKAFSIGGKAASDASGFAASGAVLKEGSSVLTTDTLTLAVLFDVAADRSLDQLDLVVTQ